MGVGLNVALRIEGFLLAADELPAQPIVPDLAWWYWMSLFWWMIWLVWLPFWIWMLWHCYKYEPDREFWFWVMLFIQPAAIVYFFARWLSAGGTAMPKGLKKFSRGREIEQLEIAARQIGNPHQWIQLGDALRDVGRFAEAADAYKKALAKEGDNIQALWGAGIASLELKQFPEARIHLEKGLSLKPDYKFGDLSLAYGKTLCEMGELDQSANHLSQHICRWRHAEALYLLATLELERGRPDEARNHLEGLILDINGSPKAIGRKQSRWKSRATKLLKQIPRETNQGQAS